jgi:hypothetical protein
MSWIGLNRAPVAHSAARSNQGKLFVGEARRRWRGTPWLLCLAFASSLACDASERARVAGASGPFPAGAGAGPAEDGLDPVDGAPSDARSGAAGRAVWSCSGDYAVGAGALRNARTVPI